jgi:long-chain acyl-CoA synthetase
MYHIFSLTVNSLAFFKYGTHNVLITNPRDIPGLIKEMGKWKFSVMTGVNTLFNALLNNEQFAKLDLSSLKFSVAGAMALQRPVLERWEKVTKSILLEGYGLTESSPVVSVNPPLGERRPGTVGLPLPSVDIQIRDESGKALKAGEVGELESSRRDSKSAYRG